MGGMRFRASTSSAVSDASSLSVAGEEPLSARSGRVVGGLRWLLEVGLITAVFAVAGTPGNEVPGACVVSGFGEKTISESVHFHFTIPYGTIGSSSYPVLHG